MSRVVRIDKVSIEWVGIDVTVPIIAAVATVNSSGWSRPRLERFFYFMPPADGIQDYDFQAEPPQGFSGDVMLPIVAHKLIGEPVEDYWGPGKPLVGVRVHSASNTVEALFDAAASPAKAKTRMAMAGETPFPLASLAASIGDEDALRSIGGRVDPAFVDELEKLLVGQLVRPFHTGDGLTLDFIPGRINIEINPATRRVVRVFTG